MAKSARKSKKPSAATAAKDRPRSPSTPAVKAPRTFVVSFGLQYCKPNDIQFLGHQFAEPTITAENRICWPVSPEATIE
jgi:hypothetical protein